MEIPSLGNQTIICDGCRNSSKYKLKYIWQSCLYSIKSCSCSDQQKIIEIDTIERPVWRR